jgi:anaerobic magnesium-protoporphyrin IX monomethyl ester cyclase
MKIFLLNPYFTKYEALIPSLGLLSMGTILQRSGIADVTVAEPGLTGTDWETTLAAAAQADIVGITCYTDSRFSAVDFASAVKRRNPGATTVLGGCHASFLAAEMLKRNPDVDYVVAGDGEEAIVSLAKGAAPSTISGLYYREKGTVVSGPPRSMRRHSMVPLDYTFLPPIITNWKDIEAPPSSRQLRHMPLIASRGCPHNCKFCGTQAMGKWRQADARAILAEMRRLSEDYGAQYLRFYDPLFVGNDQAVEEFCDLAEIEGMPPVQFRVDIRADTNPKILERLRRLGLTVVGFGVESGSYRVLSAVNKKIRRETILQAIKTMRSLDLWTLGYFILSLPEETERDRQETLELVSMFDEYNLQYFKIYPGTGYYEERLRRGMITDDFWFDRTRGVEPVYCSEQFPDAPFDAAHVIGNTIEHSSPFWKQFILEASDYMARQACRKAS